MYCQVTDPPPPPPCACSGSSPLSSAHGGQFSPAAWISPAVWGPWLPPCCPRATVGGRSCRCPGWFVCPRPLSACWSSRTSPKTWGCATSRRQPRTAQELCPLCLSFCCRPTCGCSPCLYWWCLESRPPALTGVSCSSSRTRASLHSWVCLSLSPSLYELTFVR